MQKGHFIVIDGANASGKGTQSALLVEQLKKNHIPVLLVDFPQYYTSFFGKMTARYLNGEFGQADEVSPYLATILFAQDRNLAKDKMTDFLNKKRGVIVANRYTSSALAFQGAKILSEKERSRFFKWADELEYHVNAIPREDQVIYLHVPISYAARLIKKKGERKYIKGKTHDIHEANQAYLKRAEKIYLTLAKKKDWSVIKCIEKGRLLPIDTINRSIIDILRQNGILPANFQI